MLYSPLDKDTLVPRSNIEPAFAQTSWTNAAQNSQPHEAVTRPACRLKNLDFGSSLEQLEIHFIAVKVKIVHH